MSVAVLTMLFLAHSPSLAKGEPVLSTQQISDALEHSLSLGNKFAVEAESHITVTGLGDRDTNGAWQRFTYDRNDSQWNVSLGQGQGDLSQPASFARRVVINKRGISYDSHNGKPPELLAVVTQGQSQMNYLRAQLQGGEALEGYIARDQASLSDIVRKARKIDISPDTELVNDRACYVVRCKGEHGDYSLWLDAESGLLPRRITVKKSSGDIWDRGRMSDMPETVLGRMTEYEYELRDLTTKEVDGHLVPITFVAVETKRFSSGRAVTMTIEHKRTKIDFNPDFAAIKAFEIDIPDGTRASLLANDGQGFGIRYRWHGGKLVADVDDTVLATIDASVRASNGSGPGSGMTDAQYQANPSPRHVSTADSGVLGITEGGDKKVTIGLWLGGGVAVALLLLSGGYLYWRQARRVRHNA